MTVQLNISFKSLMRMGQYNRIHYNRVIKGWRMMAAWLFENIEGTFDRKFDTESAQLQIFFEFETDAIAFKLRWL